jgi:beta-lactamase class A
MKEIKKSQNNLLLGINILLIFVVIILVFVVINISNDKVNIKDIIFRDNGGTFQYTNPILDCEISGLDNSLVVFYSEFNKKVEELKNKYLVSHISVYFRDLNNGPWIGINEKETFSPASLLKVPIFMALLFQAQFDPSILAQKVIIKQSDVNQSINQNIIFDNVLIVGQEYTLEQVVESMIQKSDNTAVPILLRDIKPKFIENIFKSIGVPFKDLSTEVQVRVKDYAGFFRVLYNSSYLDREMSEKALEILSRSDYKNGIVAGIPDGIKVAHKFGERKSLDLEESQLHDCGIIYYSDAPYILCVMTRGNNFINQENVIRDISSYVYSEVDKNKIYK